MKQEGRMKDETRGNWDKWRGVRDMMEIEWTWDREGIVGQAEWDRLCWRSVGDPVSNTLSLYYFVAIIFGWL